MIGVQSCSEVGGHRLNEDAFCVQAHPLDADCWLCFVADGQGGRAGGGPAAQLACETALAAALGCRPAALTDPSTWTGVLQQADAAVAAYSAAGFTTLVGLCIFRARVVGASSGDSAGLLVSGGKANEMTAGQHKNPPVGSGEATRRSIVAPAPRSEAAKRKEQKRRTPEGLPVQSFQCLLKHLATLSKCRLRWKSNPAVEFERVSLPTALQRRVFELLKIGLAG